MTASPPRVDRGTSTRATSVFYAVVVAIALLGNATASWGPLPFVLPTPAWLAIKAVTAAALELGGVVLAINADTRRRLGERALAWRIASGAVAGLAIAVNLSGHWAAPIFAGIFTGFSALGYGVYLVASGDRRRDQLRAEGNLPPTTPAYGLGQWLREPKLTSRARRMAQADSTLGLFGSLAAAREAIRQEIEKAALKEALADLIQETVEPRLRRAALSTVDLEAVASAMRGAADNAGMAAALTARIMTRSLSASRSASRSTPRRATGAPDGARSSGGDTRSRRARTARRAADERGGRGWWNPRRERLYEQYAARLDAGQPEMTAEEMRAELGLASAGGARNERDRRLRKRYAHEVIEGKRAPLDLSALPAGVQGAIAAQGARAVHTELRASESAE